MKNYSLVVACLLFWSLSAVSAFANPFFHETDRDVIPTAGTNLKIQKTLPGVMMMLLEKTSPRLSVAPSNRSISKGSGTTTFDVSNTGAGTMAWSAAVTSGDSWLSIASGSSGSNAGTVTCDYTANTGTLSRTGTIQITAAGAIGSPVEVTVIQTVCGAWVAPGVWKGFDCYNLAAIGKTTGDDPFTPSYRLIGGYWQWGRKGSDSSQWYNTNTSNFAHGPTGSDAGSANDGAITGWDTAYAPDGSWTDASKTANDPCSAGYRVPTKTQWDGVRVNNTQSIIGSSWSSSATHYSSARFFGEDLMLPAAGGRHYSSGALYGRGYGGYYWSSTQYSTTNAWYLYFNSIAADTYDDSRRKGRSVRCVAE